MNNSAIAGHLYDLVLIFFGVLFLAAGWLERELSKHPLSPPIVFVGLGVLIFSLFDLPAPNPLDHGLVSERATELVVIIALVIAGLKIDRPLGLRTWSTTWRLLAITMPLSILAMALLGWWAIGLVPASAILLAAILAPTDPVLAGDVEVDGPRQGPEDEVRFGLTSEAGFNDGLAFPFTYLAIAVATAGLAPSAWLAGWLAVDVLYKIGVGLLVGVASGYGLCRFLFHLPFQHRFSKRRTGFVAVAITLLVYGISELLNGYGFIAVFVAPLVMRHLEPNQRYHEELHDYAEQTEQMLRVSILFLFGGAIAGGLLGPLTWPAAITGLAFLLIIRPVTGMVALTGSNVPGKQRLALSFFGIRGIGSFYYLSYALNQTEFQTPEVLWAVAGFIVLASIIFHGIIGSPVMRYLKNHR